MTSPVLGSAAMTLADRAAGNAVAYWHDLEAAIGRGDRLGARFAALWLAFWKRVEEEAAR